MKPAWNSPQKLGCGPSSSVSGSGGIAGKRDKKAADSKKLTASATNAARGPDTATRMPPSAGPNILVICRESWLKELAASRSSSGTVTRIVACQAGVKNVLKHPLSTTSARSGVRLGAKTMASTTGTRARSAAIITVRRSNRSAHTPATGASSTRGSTVATEKAARAAGPSPQR